VRELFSYFLRRLLQNRRRFFMGADGAHYSY